MNYHTVPMPSNQTLRSVPHVTREEIRLTVQLHVMAWYRLHFLRQELDKILERMDLGSSINRNTILLVYDRDQVGESLNAKLRSHRTLIRKEAHHIDAMLYSCAATIEEYSNLDDLEDRIKLVTASSFENLRVWY